MKNVINELPVHEGKEGYKILYFASEGHGMSKKWWAETYRLQESGLLGGVYETKSGKLRRIIN